MLYLGDCLEVLRTLPDNSVDALVTDPPYGIRFMGKAWDGKDIVEHAIKERTQGPVLKSDGRVRNERVDLAREAGKYNREYEAMVAFEEWTRSWAIEVIRVLKPGAHALVFAAPRSYHRMACGMEDAGFEVRDQIQWLFGQGFPKSLDVSKAIDKAAGAERKVIGPGKRHNSRSFGKDASDPDYGTFSGGIPNETAPATEPAKQWSGWGTALKPANEPILLARKPISEKTIAANVLKWGCGGLNIDGLRIETKENCARSRSLVKDTSAPFGKGASMGGNGHAQGRFPANLVLSHSPHCTDIQCDIECSILNLNSQANQNVARFFYTCGHENIKAVDTFVGKKAGNKSDNLSIAGSGNKPMEQFPMGTISITEMETHSIISFPILNASTKTFIGTVTIESGKTIESSMAQNIVAVSVVSITEALIHFQNGQQEPITGIVSLALENISKNGAIKTENIGTNTTDGIGHPTRAFYCAKISPGERNAGLEGMPLKQGGSHYAGEGGGKMTTSAGNERKILNQNNHPTVKPQKLMRYLCRLVTPPNGTILDPFMGSGSTGLAAKSEGFKFIGIEREEEYFKISEARINSISAP